MLINWTLYIYVSKDVRIRGCFSKPKGVRLKKKTMDLLLLKLYRNDNCHVGSHKRTQRRYCMVKSVAKAYKRIYKLYFIFAFPCIISL